MLKKILSPKSCADCRLCCGFDKDDIWEIPLITPALSDYLGKSAYSNLKLLSRGDNYVFDMKFGDDGITYCPVLTEKGCALGDEKPFDCKIWPLRVMKVGDNLAITVSPVCKAVSALPVNELTSFVNDIAETVFKEAEKNPGMIKDYIDGYPIFAVKKGA